MSQKFTLTATREDYLRSIFLFEGEVGVLELAQKLNLSKSTVSERISRLVKEGLVIKKPYSKLSLTKEGAKIGKKLTFKHRVIEVFLHEYLKVPKTKVHSEAHRLEHAVSDEVLMRLYSAVGKPKRDPHGTPISSI